MTQHTVKQAVSPGHIFSFPLRAGCTVTNDKTEQRNLNTRGGQKNASSPVGDFSESLINPILTSFLKQQVGFFKLWSIRKKTDVSRIKSGGMP